MAETKRGFSDSFVSLPGTYRWGGTSRDKRARDVEGLE